MAITGLALSMKIAVMMAVKFNVFAAVTAGGSNISIIAPVLTVVAALLGSGGLGYWLDRRSAQASKLAANAVSATDVFQASLEEERTRRQDLQTELQTAKDQIISQLSQFQKNSGDIRDLQDRLTSLEQALYDSVHETNKIIRSMFNTDDEEEFKINRWQEIMISAKLAAIQSNNELTIAFISPASLSLLCYEADDLVGKPLTSIIKDDDWPIFSRALRSAKNAESRNLTSDPVSLNMKTKENKDVLVLLALGVHEDIVTLLIRPGTM
jgi:PAS domain-containing protein